MHEINATLEQRGNRYGSFKENGSLAQHLKRAMRSGAEWDVLPPFMAESLDMIASKIACILSGDPTYADSWHDIAGYATLVEKELE